MGSKTDKLTQLLPDFETEQTAFERQSEMIRALKGRDPKSARLAQRSANLVERLKECSDSSPCNLSICPVCVRSLRASFVLAAKARIDKLQSAPKWGALLPITAFQAVPLSDQYMPGMLRKMKAPAFNEKIQARHRRAGFPLVFAGIDVSWNEDSTSKAPPFWQAQLYGVVVGIDVEDVKNAIKRLYPGDTSIKRPLRVRECTDVPRALSYAVKPAFVRRVSYVDPRTGRDNTYNYDLKPPQLRELALCLGRFELPVRYALTGCRRYSDRIKLNSGVRKRLKELALARTAGRIDANEGKVHGCEDNSALV
jgi:hypothetical protein